MMPNNWIVFSDAELTSTQKLIYNCLVKYQGKHEDCFPSQKSIARDCGVSLSTVKRALKELIRHGYVHKTNQYRPDGAKTSNRYKCLK